MCRQPEQCRTRVGVTAPYVGNTGPGLASVIADDAELVTSAALVGIDMLQNA